jgi:hypothetical protein
VEGSRSRRAPLWLAAVALAAAPGVAFAGITGVCPDGSIFVVKREVDIPCSEAKRVEPNDVPPLNPEMLPRPYAWEVFQRRQDPNNPYNMIDSEGRLRPAEVEPQAHGAAPPTAPPTAAGGASPPPLPSVSAGPPSPLPSETASAGAPSPTLALSDDEVRDLDLIVTLSQERTPAGFERGPQGAPTMVVSLAHSRAFEARVHDLAATASPGPVVLFRAEAVAPARFFANFTFAQGYSAFHADAGSADEFGLLRGALGPLAAGDSVLGYVVLPPELEVSEPMDVYWNDRRISVRLRP